MIYIYVPYVDERGTGMQRFCAEMVTALLRSGIKAKVIIGEVDGFPTWLHGVAHQVILRGAAWRVLPRWAAASARLLWVQFVLPIVSGRAVLLALADSDLPIFPLMRQVAVAHDLTQAKEYRQLRGTARNFRIWLWKLGLKRSAEVIAISNATRTDLMESFGLGGERIHVIYEGFDPDIFHPRANKVEAQIPYLLYAGTLAPNKNIPFLLEVYCQLRSRSVEISLRLLGRYPRELAEQLLLSVPRQYRAAIEFRGFVSDEELASQMRGCTAFVFPSLSEGFGLAPVEAMACGAPVVSSHAGSLREVVGDGGTLLSPTDLDAWVAELAHILEDHEYRGELSRRALERSGVYSWDRAAHAYGALLTKVMRAG